MCSGANLGRNMADVQGLDLSAGAFPITIAVIARWCLPASSFRYISLVIFFLFAATTFAKDAAIKPANLSQTDVRLLIDVSGSMKKNDPQNLRAPALELLVRLLPNDNRAAIWSFGEGVNQLAPLRAVDNLWKQHALNATSVINNQARFTNIGAALARAIDAPTALNSLDKHIILLTDGMVDIDNSSEKNATERARILQKLLPSLINSSFKVHTIALSENADAELLSTISQATDGVFAIANNADELTAIFLRIFNQTVKQDLLPIKHNSFKVDASIEEFTALIFRKNPAAFTQLKMPNGELLSLGENREGINWHRAAHYDLVTVRNPVLGDWQVMVDMAENSRVSVISNFKLKVHPLKTQITSRSNVALEFYFEEQGEPLISGDFLDVLETHISLNEQNKTNPLAIIAGREITPEGTYYLRLPQLNAGERVNLVVRVDGKSFEREFSHEFQVNPSLFEITHDYRMKDGGREDEITLKLLDENFTHLLLKASVSIGGRWLKDIVAEPGLAASHQNSSQKITFLAEHTGEYKITLVGQALDEKGAIYKEEFDPIHFSYTNVKETPPAPNDQNNHVWWWLVGIVAIFLGALIFWGYQKRNAQKKLRAFVIPEKSPLDDEIPALTDVYDMPPMANRINSFSMEEFFDDQELPPPPSFLLDISDEKLDDTLIEEALFPLDDLSDTDFEELKNS